MIECNLCGMQFDRESYEETDSLLNVRKRIHERWHTRCAFEKRNTIEGKVGWIKNE